MNERKEYRRLYYLENREYIRNKTRGRKSSRAEFLAKYKVEKGCVDCGYNKHSAALQFDHIRGEKLGCLAMMKNYSMKKILAEIEKCVVRCANCHAVKTWVREH